MAHHQSSMGRYRETPVPEYGGSELGAMQYGVYQRGVWDMRSASWSLTLQYASWWHSCVRGTLVTYMMARIWTVCLGYLVTPLDASGRR